MTDPHRPEDVAAYNESALEELAWAIEASVGQFKLFLARCNYTSLRSRLVDRLRELTSVDIRILELKQSEKTLYARIQAELDSEQPDALMVLGLELVGDLDHLLSATNQVREEFRKNFHFPVVLWVSDEVLKKLLQLAPDFESWATTTEFVFATNELIDFLRQTAQKLFEENFTLSLEACREIKLACQDIQSREQGLDLEFKASIESLLGLTESFDYANQNLDKALENYLKGAELWQQSHNLARQGQVLKNIAFCYYLKAIQHREIEHPDWQATRRYLRQALEVFEQAQRPDLVANSLPILGRILQRLQDWEQLQTLAQKALQWHQAENRPLELAQDYGFLAEVALAKKRWTEAKELAQKALKVLPAVASLQSANSEGVVSEQPSHVISYHPSRYWLILGQSQQYLNQNQEAIRNLEEAKKVGSPEQDTQLYLDILCHLQKLYFEQKEYLKAFELKLERQSIEQQYGLRAFVGAGRIQPQRQAKSALIQVASQETIAPEITASGRLLDVERLSERISRNDCKLIVIHGESGVGKSSLVNGGLVPALKQKPIGTSDVLPVLMRVYSNWAEELARLLAEALEAQGVVGAGLADKSGETQITSQQNPPSSFGILEQLQQSASRNLRTVLIFDQFEEFFFVYPTPSERRRFFEFVGACLNILPVKVILSLRQDYLHYLLEFDRLPSMKIIGNDILTQNVRYSLGNFSPADAKSTIQRLTERTNFRLEPDLIEQLVQDLAGNLGEVRPIELQIVGAQLQTEDITTLNKYQQQGQKEELVKRYLAEVVSDCGADNQQVAEIVLYLLTDEKGTRPLKTRAEVERDLRQYLSVAEVQSSQIPPTPLKKGGTLPPFLRGARACLQSPKSSVGAKHLGDKSSVQPKVLCPNASPFQGLKTHPRGDRPLTPESRLDTLDLVFKIFVGSGLVMLLPELPADRYQLVHDYLAAFIRQQQEPRLKQVMAELERERTQRQRIEQEHNRALRRFFGSIAAGCVLAVLAVIAGWLAWKAEKYRQRAEIAEINSESEVRLLSNDQLWALVASVQAGRKLQEIKATSIIGIAQAQSNLKIQTADRLQQTLSRVEERNRLEEHGGSVYSVSFSPDGKMIASASADNTVKLWKSDGTFLKTLKGDNQSVYSVPPVYSVSFSPDGKMIASASADKTIKLWTRDGTLLKTLTGHKAAIFSVSFSPDGQTIASASADKTVKLWKLDGTVLKTIRGHQAAVFSVSFSPDGQIIASGSADKTVKLWKRDGTVLKTLTGHSGIVYSVSYSSDGKTIASGSADKTVKLWKSDGTVLKTLTGHSNTVYSVSFSPDSQTLASASDDKTVKLWSHDGKELKTLTGHKNFVLSVSFSPDGQTIASASADNTVKLWSRDRAFRSILTGHSKQVTNVSFSPDGQTIASASADKTVKLWNKDGTLLKTLTGHRDEVWSVSFSPDGKTIASASADKTVKLWNKDGSLLRTLTGHSGTVFSVSFSSDGQTIASASKDGTIKLWRRNGTLIKTLKGHSAAVNGVSFSPDSQIIASASDDQTVKLWNQDGQELKTLEGHKGRVNWVSFSPDGKTIASASADKTVKIWGRNGSLRKTLTGHSGKVWSVSFSPDSKLIASASDDNTVKLWSYDGTPLYTLKGYSGPVFSVTFSPTGRTLASASDDHTVILWNLDLDVNELIVRGCKWLNDYLKTNPNVTESDRHLCDGLGTSVGRAG